MPLAPSGYPPFVIFVVTGALCSEFAVDVDLDFLIMADLEIGIESIFVDFKGLSKPNAV